MYSLATGTLLSALPIALDSSSSILLFDDEQEMNLVKKYIGRADLTYMKTPNFVELCVPAMSDQYFRSCFRVSRSTFEIFCQFLGNSGYIPMNIAGKPVINVDKHALIFLFFSGNTVNFPITANHFHVSESSVHHVIKRCIGALVANINYFIKWPNNWQEVEQRFCEKYPLRGILGCIDGSHIRLNKAPTSAFPERYKNRKFFYSIVLQAVCLPDFTFIDVFCGYPGSCHDANILRRSDLWKDVEEYGVESRFPAGTYLIGDGAYPNLSWLLVPYKNYGTLTTQQKLFNKYLSSNRIYIEQAFGLLKGRFQKLRALDFGDLATAIRFVVAVACLHNLGLREEVDSYSFFENDIRNSDSTDPNNFAPPFEENISGNEKRNMIANGLR